VNFIALEISNATADAHTDGADEENETPLPPRTWGECIFNMFYDFCIRSPNESCATCIYNRCLGTFLCLSMTAPIWVMVLIFTLPKRQNKDGEWCGCILGPSAQTYNSNAQTDAKDCQPMLNGSIVLDPNFFWRNDATFCQAAQAWPYPITRPCPELSGS
jgi:hypothetical protein